MKIKLYFFIALFYISSLAISQNDFVTTWQTTTANEVIGIPTIGTGFSYDVDWENDNVFDDIGVTGNISHTYPSPGIHTVVIRGAFPRIHFRSFSSTFRAKILSVEQWGNISWTSMEEAFFGCQNLAINALDTPDLSGVTNMYAAFLQVVNFNQQISNWDVSTVTNMRSLFEQSGINQPLNSWDVSGVTDMVGMFSGTPFNQPLDNWDMSAVTTLQVMFFNNYSFNQSIDNWDISSVNDTSGMFLNATSFNQPIENWDVSNVGDMQLMFEGATSFNQSLNNWDVSSVRYMNSMFEGATSFNRRIGNWNVMTVDDMANMFEGAIGFNQPLPNWNVSGVFNMSNMFNGATSFDQTLGNWDVSNVTNMADMFLNVKLSITNYDDTLIGWETLTLQPNVPFHGGNSQYCNAEPQRINMINNNGWTITDGGQTICGSLGTDEFDEVVLALFPNPATNSFSIEKKHVIKSISVFDIQGKTVKSFKENLAFYDIEDLTSGLYFVNIETEKGKITKKLIKE